MGDGERGHGAVPAEKGWRRMRYFVTGATGFIGGETTRQLVAAGHEVVALVRNPSAARGLLERGVTLAPGDVGDRESLRAGMAGCDGVFHIAGWYKIGRPDVAAAEAINVAGTRNVLEVMRDLGIPRGVYTSTVAVFSDTHGKLPDETYRYDGPHISVYDRTKWQAHYEVADPLIHDGLPLIIVQPGVVYGPGDISAIHETWVDYLRRRLPAVPRGIAYCWGHVADTAAGHLLAMERGRPGESYIIAGPPHTLADALRLAEGITGVPAPRRQLSPGMMRAAAALVRPFEGLLPLPNTYTSEGLRVSAGVTYLGSNAKACRELGYAPRTLEEGLPETLRAEMAALGMRPAAG